MKELRATYRLQLGPHLDFAGAAELIPYLGGLGVSHLYLSPVWRARPGSTHGYDVLDPAQVSDELGGEDGLRALATAASEWDLGLILDVVPNHMAADDSNPYWSDPQLREKFFDLDRTTGRHRRFFDIDDLAGVRQEDPEVFAATHAKVIELVRDGVADGIRVDHPDGLTDPAGYLRQVRDAGIELVWVEKILDAGEWLRDDWLCEGTTGYDFGADVQALFIDPTGEQALTELWHEFSGDSRPFAEVAAEAKLEQARATFGPELDRLDAIHEVEGAREAAAMLPVYRTYVDPAAGPENISEADREVAAALPEPVRRALLLEDDSVPAEWVTRFQQISAPVMAKGVEDTAFYRYGRLLALNDVGNDPGRFSLPVAGFHEANRRRAATHPRSLLATSTHDSKRSADVRARIGILAEIANEGWYDALPRWLGHTEAIETEPAIGNAEKYILLQNLLGTAEPVEEGVMGAHLIEPERMTEYMIKAAREAKQRTSWTEPDEAYEAALAEFIDEYYSFGAVRSKFDSWVMVATRAGGRVALAQTVLKLTVPGIPDIYQGDEHTFVALVDPDNRRAVDWELRQQALAALESNDQREQREAVPEVLFKIDAIRRILDLRYRRPEPFAGDYLPIEAGDEVCAFMRGDEVITAVPLRGQTGLRRDRPAPDWQLPEAAAGIWIDVLTGTRHELPSAPLEGILESRRATVLERVG